MFLNTDMGLFSVTRHQQQRKTSIQTRPTRKHSLHFHAVRGSSFHVLPELSNVPGVDDTACC
jgi:hypothetical protein